MKTLERRVEEMHWDEEPHRNGGRDPTDTHQVEEAPSYRAAPVGAACRKLSQSTPTDTPTNTSRTRVTFEPTDILDK